MSGTMVIRDDAVWMPAGWVFDNVLELIASELQVQDPPLSKDLLNACTNVSVGYLDLSTLEPSRFRSLIQAVERAYNHVVEEGPNAFHDPAFYEGFVKRFDDLKTLLHTDARAQICSP